MIKNSSLYSRLFL